MSDFIIVTSSTSDLPKSYCDEFDVRVIPYSFQMNDKEYFDNFEQDMGTEDFYNKMREGATPTTSMVNQHTYYEWYKKLAAEGKDILFIEFSSGLTSSTANAFMALEQISGEIENKIIVVDSLCASVGLGLLVDYAVRMRAEGKSIEETAAWVEEHKYNMIHWFTVDDLVYLKRGGRVSSAAAAMGTMLNIKPVLDVDDNGHLIPISKVRGRKKSILEMFENMKKDIDESADTVFIGHGSCKEDAEFLQSKVKEFFPQIKTYRIHNIGPTIGAHTGPGVLALFYYGKKRT